MRCSGIEERVGRNLLGELTIVQILACRLEDAHDQFPQVKIAQARAAAVEHQETRVDARRGLVRHHTGALVRGERKEHRRREHTHSVRNVERAILEGGLHVPLAIVRPVDDVIIGRLLPVALMLLEEYLFDDLAGLVHACVAGVARRIEVCRGKTTRRAVRLHEQLVDDHVRASADRGRHAARGVFIAGRSLLPRSTLSPGCQGNLPPGNVGKHRDGDHAERSDGAELEESGVVVCGEGQLESHVVHNRPGVQVLGESEPVVETSIALQCAGRAGAAHDVIKVGLRRSGIPGRAVVEGDAGTKGERDLKWGRLSEADEVRDPAGCERAYDKIIHGASFVISAVRAVAIVSNEPLVDEVISNKLIRAVGVRVHGPDVGAGLEEAALRGSGDYDRSPGRRTDRDQTDGEQHRQVVLPLQHNARDIQKINAHT